MNVQQTREGQNLNSTYCISLSPLSVVVQSSSFQCWSLLLTLVLRPQMKVLLSGIPRCKPDLRARMKTCGSVVLLYPIPIMFQHHSNVHSCSFLPCVDYCNINTSLKHKVQCTAQIFSVYVLICVLDESKTKGLGWTSTENMVLKLGDNK